MSLVRNIGAIQQQQTDAEVVLNAIADSGAGPTPPNATDPVIPAQQAPAPAAAPVLTTAGGMNPIIVGLGLAAVVYALAKRKR